MSILPKIIYSTFYQDSNDSFCRNRKIHPKIHTESKGPQIAKTILKKKNNARGLTFPYFKTYYKATVIKTVWYWHKDKHTNQLNRRGSRNQPSYVWIFNKSDKQDYSMGKGSFFNKWWWENWISTCKRMKLNHYLIPYTKITENK